MTRLIFLDTETTGLSHEGGDRIIEIGCIEMVNRRLTGRSKHFYVNPQRANSDDALKVHGLTDEFLRCAVATVSTSSGSNMPRSHHAHRSTSASWMPSWRLVVRRHVGRRSRLADDGTRCSPAATDAPAAPEVDNTNRTLHGALPTPGSGEVHPHDAGDRWSSTRRRDAGAQAVGVPSWPRWNSGDRPQRSRVGGACRGAGRLDKASSGRTLCATACIIRAPLQGG
jgi:hypothetical protein